MRSPAVPVNGPVAVGVLTWPSGMGNIESCGWSVLSGFSQTGIAVNHGKQCFLFLLWWLLLSGQIFERLRDEMASYLDLGFRS